MRRGYKFKGSYPCPYCSAEAKSAQGLSGHIQMAHPEKFEEWRAGTGLEGGQEEKERAPDSLVSAPTSRSAADVRRVKNEVELLQLEAKKRQLLRELGDGQPQHFPDVSEVAGAGSLDPEIKRVVQSRMFDTQPQQTGRPTWLEFLNSPNLSILLAGLKGVLGNQGGDLSGLSSLLSLLGMKDLKGVLGASASPPVVLEKDVSLMGFDLPAGLPVNPELLVALVQTASSKGKDSMMADALTSAVTRISKLIEDERAGREGGIGGKPKAGERDIRELTCSECKSTARVDMTDAAPGDEFVFRCPKCDHEESMTVVDEREEAKKVRTKPPKKQARAEPDLPKMINCPDCNQAISVEGLALGSVVTCPVCQKELTLSSEDIPMAPAEPQPTQETLYSRNQDIQRRQ